MDMVFRDIDAVEYNLWIQIKKQSLKVIYLSNRYYFVLRGAFDILAERGSKLYTNL